MDTISTIDSARIAADTLQSLVQMAITDSAMRADTVYCIIKNSTVWKDFVVPILGLLAPAIAAWAAYLFSIRKGSRAEHRELINTLLSVKAQFDYNADTLDIMSNFFEVAKGPTAPIARLDVSDIGSAITRVIDHDLLRQIKEVQNHHRTMNNRWGNLDFIARNRLAWSPEQEQKACDLALKLTHATSNSINEYIKKHDYKVWKEKIEVKPF